MTFPKKIMLVNHEPRLTDSIRSALECTGRYRIRIEQESAAALHAARWFAPDLILLEAVKGEVEGREVITKMQSEPSLRDTPFLFFSETMGSGGFVNGYRFQSSPVRVDEIVRCVDEILHPENSA